MTTNEKNKMNLYQKLVEVRKEVKYIKKSNDGYKFKYASEGTLLAAIRDKMDEMGVFLETDMLSLENVDCTFIKDKAPIKVEGLKATFEFTWVNADNPSETIKKRVIVQDAESIVKTVGGLMTYASRYFLYKFFSVATDNADPDAFENGIQKNVDGASAEEFLSRQQQETIRNLADESRIARICKTYAADSLADIDARHYEYILGSLRSKVAQ